jgi:hypothetical protein
LVSPSGEGWVVVLRDEWASAFPAREGFPAFGRVAARGVCGLQKQLVEEQELASVFPARERFAV